MVIVAQIIGIVAMIINILSFQCKKNRNLFLVIGIGSVLFSVSFLMLGDYAAAIYNIISIIRSSFALKKKFLNKYVFSFLCVLYVGGMVLGTVLKTGMEIAKETGLETGLVTVFETGLGAGIGTILLGITPWVIVMFIAQIVQTFAMYFTDGGVIRKSQIFFVSPVWLINNIIVISIGGILCEAFIIASAVISYFRFRKSGFDK